MRKNKRSYIALALVGILISLVYSFTLSPTSWAEETYDKAVDGTQKTARFKEWFTPLSTCISSGLWTGDDILFNYGRIKPEDIRDNQWFEWATKTANVNPFIEKQIDANGKWGDSLVFCSENKNALVEKAISYTSSNIKTVSGKDFICDWNDHTKYGVLSSGKTSTACDVIYDSDYDPPHDIYFDDTLSKSAKDDYLYNMAVKYLFDGSIPYGSPWGLTDLEKYYVVHDVFTNSCTMNNSANQVGGNLDPFKANGNYIISELNPSTKKVEDVGYYGYERNPGPDTNIFVFYDWYMTCREMEAYLHNSEGVKKLKAYASYTEEEGIDPSEDASDNGKVEKNCQNQGGAGALGWIVCSILDWMQRTTDTMYEGVVEPALVVNKSFFEGDTVYNAWTTFRDISNIIFIILLLMVIFSQVTGVGIDNYGVKKILPKLIIAAVLVNLSYWICLVCVDISNILGAGFQDFFNGIPVTADPVDSVTIAVEDGSVAINGILSKGLVAVTVVGAAATAIAVVTNPALLLTLFVSVLGVLIAVLFMFILLAGRKAAIILLTIFSPVAFVLYLLPNTKKLFDKWIKLWEAMLFLYPIAGLLIGGGNFASRIMLNIPGGGATTIFTAMIVGIIPIFFIPTVLKGAFSAMGSIGGAIAGAGNRMRSGATRRMKNSDMYKNAQQMGLDRKNRIKSGLNKNGELTALGRLRHKVAGSKPGQWIGADRRLNARTKAARKTMSEQEEASATSMELLAASEMGDTDWIKAVDGSGTKTGNNLFSGRRENYYASNFMKAAKKGDRKSMNAALAAAKSAGVKDKDIAKMVRHAANSGVLSGKDKQGNDDPQMSLWLQSLASTNKALAKDVELQDWAAKGGTEKLGGYGDYAAKMKPSDLDKGKISNASTESLAGLAKAGVLQTETAREVLQDGSAQLSPDKRIILGAVRDKQIVTSGATVDGIVKDAEALSTGDPPASGGRGINSGVTASYANENWVAPPPKPVVIK